MKKSLALPGLIAIAACSFELQAGNDLLATVQVTPDGFFKPIDGRPLSVPGWYIDSASAPNVIAAFNARKTDLVVDYEHQTLHKEKNGQPAPAAAWFRSLEWRDGQGLFATVELTQDARDQINNKKYRYFSPVFRYHPKTGQVISMEMGALTNTPAVDGMEELTLLAAACFGATTPEDENVKLLQTLIPLLALPATATEDEAVAALNAKLTGDPLKELRKALGVKDDADEQALVAACSALKEQTGEPDPAKYVPVAALSAVQEQLTALNAKFSEREKQEADDLIAEALEDGRLLKPLEGWARDLAKTNIAALNAYLDKATPLSAALGSQTNGKQPEVDSTGLTQEELAVCNNMGIDPEDYKKQKPAAA